jgi:phosphoglycolate phosphatase
MAKEACIIFDMDGTLIDSSFAMAQSVNHVRKHLGLAAMSKEDLEYYINQPDQDLPKIFYNTTEYDPTHRSLFREHYLKSSSEHISLYPDVKEMLQFMSERSKLCVATNASDFFARHMLEHLQIIDFFDGVVGANNVPSPKPNPMMLELLMENTSTLKERTLMVGDSIKDEQAAENADIPFIFVNWGYGKSETASMKANNMHELIALFHILI